MPFKRFFSTKANSDLAVDFLNAILEGDLADQITLNVVRKRLEDEAMEKGKDRSRGTDKLIY